MGIRRNRSQMGKMGQMDHGIGQPERLIVIDALRGTAISAILLIHSSNHFLYGGAPEDSPGWLLQLDSLLKSMLYGMFEGKAYILFAFLFGYTFALQTDNQRKRGKDFGIRMAWRMLWLMGFGAANAIFFAGGDPLAYYALCMLPVITLRNSPDKLLLILSIVFLFQPLEIIDEFIPILGNEHIQYYIELQRVVAFGDFFQMAVINMTSGLKGSFLWAIETGRFTPTVGLFIVGMLAYRRDLFRMKSRVLGYYATGCCIGAILVIIAGHYSVNGWFDKVGNLMITASFIPIFILLHRMSGSFYFWRYIGIYGRMSLTNFISQSVIGSFIFYPWGLNMASHLGVTLSVLTGTIILILQIAFSTWWLQQNKKGPLENLWYKLTWLDITFGLKHSKS